VAGLMTKPVPTTEDLKTSPSSKLVSTLGTSPFLMLIL